MAQLPQEYTSLFRNEYSNLQDDFEIIIYSKFTATEQNISATCRLSYKDADSILAPIRGAQLDIIIDASVSNPFNLFLDFKEKDFAAELYRNGILLFQGFISPEGVTQSYNTINWRITITATDNLAGLENTEFKYKNELPTEHVFLDKCLKSTGLSLPIAFFDDVNERVVINGINQVYGLTLNDTFFNRVINPDVFKNENGRFASYRKVLNDILQKYNAVIKQENIEYFDESDGQIKNQLCWLFYRPALLAKTFLNGIRPYEIKFINGYSPNEYTVLGYDKTTLNPIVEDVGKFASPSLSLGTDGQSNLDAIHKNANQLIRQTRALQNFRFQQNWVIKKTIIDYKFDNFEYIGQPQNEIYFQEFDDKARFKAVGIFNTATFDPEQPLEDQPNVGFVKFNEIEVPEETNVLELSGEGNIVSGGQNYYTALHFAVLHTDSLGNRRYLQSPPKSDGAYALEQLFIPQDSTFEDATWVLQEDIDPDALGNLRFTNISNIVFAARTEENASVDFKVKFPPTPEKGGTYTFYFSPNYIRTSLLDSVPSSIWDQWRFDLNDFRIRIVPPERLGSGEYHDALNLQNTSTKLDNPVSVINADEDTNFFLNSLQYINLESPTIIGPENYPYWTTRDNSFPNKKGLLELMSIERIRLFSKSQNVFSGDIHGYLPYFCKLQNTAYNNISFTFTKWIYDTAENTIEAEMREIAVKNPSVKYEKSYIFEDEENRLIE